MKHFVKMLGADESATWSEIRESYREQIKVWHPDRFVGDESLHRKAEERTKEIHYALRRLEELKQDLGDHFEPDKPFLKLYADKTHGGQGAHGKVTFEDRRMGYLSQSFGNWQAITSSLSDSMTRSADVLRKAVQPRARRRTTTIRVAKKSNSLAMPYFFLLFGCIVVLSTIGAYNLMQLIPDERHANLKDDNQLTQSAERELIQMLLTEPTPRYEQNLDRTARLALVAQRKNEPRPALMRAAMSCDLRGVSTEIHQGAELNSVDSLGQTALIWAAKNNCYDVAHLLLERGARTDIRSTNGFTAFRWASWYRHEKVLKVFAIHKVQN